MERGLWKDLDFWRVQVNVVQQQHLLELNGPSLANPQRQTSVRFCVVHMCMQLLIITSARGIRAMD